MSTKKSSTPRYVMIKQEGLNKNINSSNCKITLQLGLSFFTHNFNYKFNEFNVQ